MLANFHMCGIMLVLRAVLNMLVGCLVRGVVGGEWMRGLGFGFTNPVGTGGVLDVCLCFGCGGG